MRFVRRIVEFFMVPYWARRIINKYREMFGEENVVYSVLDRRNVVISFRIKGKWYRSYCSDHGFIVTCFDESIASILSYAGGRHEGGGLYPGQ